ncbi:MAG TPA: hypothetical protein V6D28_01085 [Leptolyngbyaceae cyanobacterium]
MATKKRLSDLLRQEAQKLPDTEDKPIVDTTATEVVEEDTATPEPLSAESSDNGKPAKSSNPTKAELEATVAELRAALEQAQKLEVAQEHEVALQQQVIDLQAELSEEKSQVQKLKKDLEQVKSLKAELEKAKKDLEQVKSLKTELEKTKKEALQLAESNSKLIEEVNALKQEKEQEDKKEKETKTSALPAYRPIERKIGKSDPNKKPVDFAVNTWLLD